MIDVTDATFQTVVLDRSMQTPVVIDLWAPWCGPCKTLGPMLEKIVKEYGLGDRVEFLGLRSDIPDLMRNSDFFVRPSTLEGMPLTVLEAMASGIPVVATNVAGTGEAVLDGQTGILVEPGDVEALAEALETIIRDRPTRLKMGGAGRARVEASFSWDRVAERSLEVLETARR